MSLRGRQTLATGVPGHRPGWQPLPRAAGAPILAISGSDVQVEAFRRADLALRPRDPVLELEYPRAGRVREHPVLLQRRRTSSGHHPPVVGEHARKVPVELGYSHEEVHAFDA